MDYAQFDHVKEDEIVNIYEDEDGNDNYGIEFQTGNDIIKDARKLRERYDYFETMWAPDNASEFGESKIHNFKFLKQSVERAAFDIDDDSFTSLKWILSGSATETSFYNTVQAVPETELRSKLFGDVAGKGSEAQERTLKEYLNIEKYPLIQINDYDFMLIPDSIILSDEKYIHQTQTPGFYNILLSNNFQQWDNCCITQCIKGKNISFLSRDLVMDTLRKVFEQLQKDGQFFVKEGKLDFQVAVLRPDLSRGTIISFFDIVFGVECSFWPTKAESWITREREWPPQESLTKIKQGGFHLVPKINKTGNFSLDWRISFSKAETIISRLPLVRLYAIIPWRLLKGTISITHHNILTSYILKTLLFYALERMPVNYWFNDENLIKTLVGILDDIMKCIALKDCPHYFIPEIDLFKNIQEEFLITLANQLNNSRKQLISDPCKFIFSD